MQQASLPRFSADWCFFLDLDGTLVDIAARPNLVRIDASLRDLLQRLAALTAGGIALVSGRSMADIDRLFAPLRLPVAGQHGLERRDASGALHAFDGQPQHLRAAALPLERLVAQHPALDLEQKGMTLALHYRRVPALATAAVVAMDEARQTLGETFELLHGKMVVEIKPAGKDKGTAVAEFMQEAPFASRIPVYIGDDTTDEHAFVQVNRLGGHSLKVGDGATQAQWRLTNPQEVRAWLAAFVNRYAISTPIEKLNVRTDAMGESP